MTNNEAARTMNLHRLAFTIILLLHAIAVAAQAVPPVAVLTLEGAVTPASADYINRGIARAAKENAQLVVLNIDTPGGLDSSMRSIIKTILASPVPVATFVAPSGARAASAGTYILYASHIAAMAPGTNLGAATPVQIGGSSGDRDGKDSNDANKDANKDPAKEKLSGSTLAHKQINDASAYIRGLAQLRGRNIEWAEKAVREAVSLPSSEAAKMHVVDLIANDLSDLMKALDGKTISVQGQEKHLHTAGAPLVHYEADWRTRFLSVITDPSIALILLAIGTYGLLFEFMSPGMALPGVLGGICLLLALYALQLLPVNYAGLGLIFLAIGFMVAETFFPTYGALGFGGVVAFIFGAVILIEPETPGFGIPIGLITGMAVLSALLIAAIAGVAARTHRRMTVIGDKAWIGKVAEVQDNVEWASLHGESWKIVSKEALQPKQKVKILARRGLVLEVVPFSETGKGE
jgi:membrane-bound serine protease (ClpP class)